MSRPLKGFITYAHKNTTAKDELITRLAVMQQRNELVTWHDAEMTGGDKWREEIFKHLADSDILLYLVSAASLASENCNKELVEAISSDIRIIPIILEDCDWLNHQLSDFQAFPDKGKPINEWQPESKGWQDVVNGIRNVVEEMQTGVQNGTLPEWIFQQGNFLMMLGQIDKAIEAYSHAITLKSDYADAYNNRGVAYGNKGNYDRAIKDCNKAIQLNPNLAEAYNNRGVAYDGKGEFDHAIADYTKAIAFNPNLAMAYYNRGRACGKRDDYDRAIEDFNKAITLKSDYADAYNNRGVAYDGKGEFDHAIADYTKAIVFNPNLAEAYHNRGGTYKEKGDIDRAIADYTEAIALKSDYANAYNNRGNAYNQKDEFERAIADLNKAIEINSNYALAYYNRGLAWLSLGEWEKARVDLTTARSMGVKLPADIAAMLTPQVVAETGLDEFLGNYARAWEGLEKALQLKGSSIHTDLDDPAPKDIEKILQKVRAEAEEERRLDQELDAIPETAYEDVDRFLKTVNKFVPLPDIMPLDNGEICLEWREGQKIFTLSFGGDRHIVFAGIFGAENQARGILTFSMPHLIAVIGMITGLYLDYDN